jgi:hypothetical protein
MGSLEFKSAKSTMMTGIQAALRQCAAMLCEGPGIDRPNEQIKRVQDRELESIPVLGKTRLMEMIAGTNRGILATENTRTAILAAIAQLEERNPTPEPTKALTLLNGDWQLLYTTSQELLGIDRGPLIKLGQIYQSIRTDSLSVYNIAEITGLPYLDGLVSVVADFEVASACRVNVKFKRSVFGLQSWVNYHSPKQFIPILETGKRLAAIDMPISRSDRPAWIDITYLDNNLRINRGNAGSVFVLTRA